MSQPGTHHPRRGLTRDDLIALGRSGRPRDFIPLAAQVVERVPEDGGLRFLLAANVAQLGLKTLAVETLAELPAAALQEPDVRTLLAAIERLPDDRIGPEERAATAAGNIRALRVRGVDLAGAFEVWREGLAESDCFRCADGNLVRRIRREGAPPWTHFLTDQRGAAERFAAHSLAGADAFPRPLTIEGLDPPWLFDQAYRTLERNALGYGPPITIVQADPHELLDGLSALDLREQLVDPRVRVLVGPDASQRWLNDALERLDEVVLGAVVRVPSTRTQVAPPLEAMTGRASAAQAEEYRRVRAKVDGIYRGRDTAWWAERYAEARRGGRPLRVLVPTSRYSTYIRHAAQDLADAFRALGCEAVVAAEAGWSSRPSTVGHARLIERHEPDLIALINYFRGDAGLPFPDEVPWLCWLQDALPHQFKERRFGPLDFVAGHVHKELRAEGGVRPEQTLPFPVVASARKFHPGPVNPVLRERFACDIAYVSHQSETPERFHARCKREDPSPEAARLLDELRPLVEAEALDPMRYSLLARLERVTRDVVEDSPLAGSDKAVYVFRHYALPLADRVIRHQMLGWAAEICLRRGWRLRLYGRGWDHHPEFAPFARSELAHGEDLRACYQSSLIHLHGSVSALVHQRVMECALSGGLPLARLTYDALSESGGWARREALLHCHPTHRDVATGRIGFESAATPPLAAVAAQHQRLGLEFPEIAWISAPRAESYRRPDHPCASGLHPAWLFGELTETTFRSAADLERLVESMRDDPRTRQRLSAEMAARVRERCTTETFAEHALEMIATSLAKAAGARCEAA